MRLRPWHTRITLLLPSDVVYMAPETVAVSEEEPGGGIRVLDVSAWGAGRQVVSCTPERQVARRGGLLAC